MFTTITRLTFDILAEVVCSQVSGDDDDLVCGVLCNLASVIIVKTLALLS